MSEENKQIESQDPESKPAGGEGEKKPETGGGAGEGGKDNAAFARLRAAEKAANERAAALQKEIDELKRSKMTEDEKLKADLEAAKPKAAKFDAYSKTVSEILDVELAEVPEDKRELVPDLDPIEKLKWVRNAKTKGLFAPPSAVVPEKKPGTGNGAPPPNGGGGTSPDMAAYEKELATASTPAQIARIAKKYDHLNK